MGLAQTVTAPAARLALAFTFLFPPALAGAQAAPEVLADYQSIKLVGVLRNGGPQFEVYLDCVPFHSLGPRRGQPAEAEFLGTDGQEPSCVVGSFVVKLGGAATIIPVDSYTDLADVAVARGVYVTKRGRVVVVHIRGGDGTGSYKARFIFRGARLVSREIEQLDESGEPVVKRTAF